MTLRSKLVAGVATFALVGGLGLAQTALAADPMPAAPGAAPATAAPGQPLTEVQSKDAIVGAKVKDNKGEAVGEVKSVKLGADGKIASVNVAVGTKTIALKADGLTYAQADNTLTSAQTKAEIQKMPST
jgi:sporulation protein YlmC with PRC-barrel domain